MAPSRPQMTSYSLIKYRFLDLGIHVDFDLCGDYES